MFAKEKLAVSAAIRFSKLLGSAMVWFVLRYRPQIAALAYAVNRRLATCFIAFVESNAEA